MNARIRLLALALTVIGAALTAQTSQAAGTVSLKDLEGLLELRTDQVEIIALVKNADVVKVTPKDLPKLKALGAGKELLAVIAGKIKKSAFSIDTIIEQVTKGKGDEEIIEQIQSHGMRITLTAQDRLKLLRAKVSVPVIKAIEGKHVYKGFKLYKDPLGLLSIQHPADWNSYQWYTGSGFKILLSPEKGVARENEFTTGLQIQLSFVDEHSAWRKRDIFDMHTRTLPALIRGNRKFKLARVSGREGIATRMRLANLPAVRQKLSLTTMGKPCLDFMYRVVADDMDFFMEFVAPKDKSSQYEPLYDKMVKTFRPFPDRAPAERKNRPMAPSELLELYREATVMILAEFSDGPSGFGSGFFVREDGFVLTNHHVICGQEDHSGCTSPSRMKLAKKLSIMWDGKVGPKRKGEKNRRSEAFLEDTVYSRNPTVDLALLRIPRATKPYRAIPISPVGQGLVREGDAIAAIGFPRPNRFKIGNLFTTQGIISRFNYIEQRFGTTGSARKLNDLYTTSEIQPGNSGGPAVSCATGGVIGLNTYITTSLAGKELDYFGVCPIDHALYYFPQIRWYPRKGRMPGEGHLELAAMLLAGGNLRSAGIELSRALKSERDLLPAQRARLYYQLARYYSKRGNRDTSAKMVKRCLDIDEFYADALIDIANRHSSAKRPGDAIAAIDKLVKKEPDFWWPRYHRASIYRAAGRKKDALADIDEAIKRGGSFDPVLYRLQGLVHLDRGDLDKALGSFKNALKVEPADFEARLSIADCYVRKKNISAAILEYARCLQDHREEPRVLESYGRFLSRQKGKPRQALEHLSNAAIVTLNRGGTPSIDLLKTICALAHSQPGEAPTLLAGGKLIHQHWPKSRHWAHYYLGKYWDIHAIMIRDSNVLNGKKVVGRVRRSERFEKLEDKTGWIRIRFARRGVVTSGWVSKADTRSITSLATAHFLASDRLYELNHGKKQNLAEKSPRQAMSALDVLDLVRSNYGPALFSETLDHSNLAFRLSQQRIDLFKKMRFPPWVTYFLSVRMLRDQLTGGESLGSLVKITPPTKLQEDTHGMHGAYSFENTGEIPLMSVKVRKMYLDKDNRVLWSSEGNLRARDPVFTSRRPKPLHIWYDTWAALKKAGIAEKNVKKTSLAVVSARNATFLWKLKMEDIRQDKQGYHFTIANRSSFTIRNPTVLMTYVDEKKNPIRHPKTRISISDSRVVNVVIRPGAKSRKVTVKQWIDPGYLKRLGIPGSAKVFLRPVIVDAVPSLK
ncbi:MAG: tetratricopeptide repeat-containing serine protease family protein [Phycisphaerae bacterium]|jgi:tetratricopeptide (TPR) repeat protein/S1-C subfamily serine protease|nr:tetratricopeptide repeat-containing serine protease family protein [Phycisphaerae bacterium]